MSSLTIAAATAIAIAAGSSAVLAASTGEMQSCFTDWSEAAPVVVAHNLIPAKGLEHLARQHVGGDVVRITLCREEARFVYRLLIRQGGGQFSHVTVDAVRPFAP